LHPQPSYTYVYYQETQNDFFFLKLCFSKHFVHFFVFWWCNYHIMCYITKIKISNLEVNLKGYYNFIYFYLENLKVEGSCSWSLKVFVFVLKGWRFLLLFLEVEGSWYMLCEMGICIYFLKWCEKILHFFRSWFVKCNLKWWGFVKGDLFILIMIIMLWLLFTFEHLIFWGGRWSWNYYFCSNTHYLCAFMMTHSCVIGLNFDNVWIYQNQSCAYKVMFFQK
jgi:hypothetical protein